MRTTLLLLLIITSGISVRAEVNLNSIMQSVTHFQLERFPNASVLATKQDIDFSDALLLDSKNDTIYIIESVADTGLYDNISVWNKRSNVTVLNIGSESEIKTPIYFNTETKYIEQWDTTMLLKAGANINIQTNRYTVEQKDIGHHWATRIIIANGKISCETIKYYYPWFEEDMDRRFNRLTRKKPKKNIANTVDSLLQLCILRKDIKDKRDNQ